jgi:ElaB/YqjD/DUF883 family membrane-anchored ribosome-binding protein
MAVRQSKNSRKRRTDEEVQELNQRVEALLDKNPEVTNTAIAEELGITLSKVSDIRISLGRTAKRTTAQMQELCDRYQNFLRDNPKASIKVAAEVLGVKKSLVVYIRRKLQCAPRRSLRAREKLKVKIEEVLRENPDISNRDLAAITGKPKTTVGNIRRDLRLSRDADDSKDILFLSIGQQVRDIVIQEGDKLTDKQLAKKVGISLRTLQRWLEKLGIPTGKIRRYSPDEEYFRKMWADGWSDVEIAKVMGCWYTRVQKWRYRNKLPANVIHDSLRTNALCRSHTPTTLLDIYPGSPTGSKKYDRIWAFAALGANWDWLCKRFPDAKKHELQDVVDILLNQDIPRNLRKIIRRKQLEGHGRS